MKGGGEKERKKKRQDNFVERPAGRSKAIIVHTVERIIVSDTGNPSSFTSRLAKFRNTAVFAQLCWEQPEPCEHPGDFRVRSNFFIFGL